MYRFTLLAEGKLPLGPLQELATSYLRCMSPYAKWDMREVKTLSELPREDAFVVVLDEEGKTFDSKTFAARLDAWSQNGARPVLFVLGGAFGLSDAIKKAADSRLALSPMTFPHDLARVILFEQLYRAITILKGKSYHK